MFISKRPEMAFQRFTTEIASWWPMASKPGGVSRTGAVVLEGQEGGKIFHRRKDGEVTRWGTVKVWDPPNRMTFFFHPNRDQSEAQTVEVSFQPEEEGTRVTLVHSGWEAVGAGGEALREEFDSGWDPILGRFAAPDGD